MLSNTKNAGLCVLGTKIFYVLCTAYGLLLSGITETAPRAVRADPRFRRGKLVSVAWGRGLYGSAAGCRLVHLLDAQRKSLKDEK
jgi:hypothetical protein